MAKLTQAELKAHAEAEALLKSSSPLNIDQIIDVISGWHEGATHSNAATSAFFTPIELANTFAIEVPSGGRILDMCAGIGTLSAAALAHHYAFRDQFDLTLVEVDERYCEVAQRLLPDAKIICGSLFDPDIQAELAQSHFDVAISNPPYGNRNIANGRSPRYTGKKCEYAVIDIASDLADFGVFLIPQTSAPFRQSGVNFMKRLPEDPSSSYGRFHAQTQIEISPGIGIDTSFAEKLWRGTTIRTEIVTCDFVAARQARCDRSSHEPPKQADFFDLAA